jgi:hypothetical protein
MAIGGKRLSNSGMIISQQLDEMIGSPSTVEKVAEKKMD